METFGDWLREQRLAKKLRQEDVAKAAGLTRVTIANLENNRSRPRQETILYLASAIGANTNEAYRRAGYNPPDNADADQELAEYATSLMQRLRPSSRPQFLKAAKQQLEILASMAEPAA